MEENGSHVVQVAIQGEKTSPSLVAPDLNLVIISSGHKEGLGRVEVNASNRAIVFFEAIYQGSHAIVP